MDVPVLRIVRNLELSKSTGNALESTKYYSDLRGKSGNPHFKTYASVNKIITKVRQDRRKRKAQRTVHYCG